MRSFMLSLACSRWERLPGRGRSLGLMFMSRADRMTLSDMLALRRNVKIQKSVKLKEETWLVFNLGGIGGFYSFWVPLRPWRGLAIRVTGTRGPVGSRFKTPFRRLFEWCCGLIDVLKLDRQSWADRYWHDNYQCFLRFTVIEKAAQTNNLANNRKC